MVQLALGANPLPVYLRKVTGTAEAANCRRDIAGTTCAAGPPEVIRHQI